MAESILITGGAGFIGSHLAESLLREGHSITVLDNFNPFYDPSIKRQNIETHREFDDYSLIEGDIRNLDLIDNTFRTHHFDEVIHLAAMAGVRPSIKNPVLYNEVNVAGTMNLLEACRKYGVKRFIFASSSSVYGDNRKVPYSEDDAVDNPISPYAMTKKAGELMAYTYHHLYGIKTACLRFFTVYGPRQRPEMAIHLFTDRIFNDQEIKMFGNGSSCRDYTYIDDIIDGIAGFRKCDFAYEIVNLGRSDTVKLSDLIAKIERISERKARIIREPFQPGDVIRTYADISKAKSMFGYNPSIDIDEGLKRFIKWYLEKRMVIK